MPQEKKIILLDKNLNNKIGSDFMIHVMKGATAALPKAAFSQVITFKCGDAAADYKLWDYVKEQIKKIPLHMMACSHGTLQREEFEQWMYEKHSLHPNDDAGIYFFTKHVDEKATEKTGG